MTACSECRTIERQLRLFDFRLRQTEVHAFGWKQESSDSQSALINQAWSPDGLYITSGSVDPVIHVFDIRYNSHKPSQSIKAHQKRVFKAIWHHAVPLLISISSDLNIGLHKIIWGADRGITIPSHFPHMSGEFCHMEAYVSMPCTKRNSWAWCVVLRLLWEEIRKGNAVEYHLCARHNSASR